MRSNTVKKRYTQYDALKVPLAGSNLIEASAGTGKTYSIAVMVLRLLLEKKIPIQKILMVTFTKAAVAELEERIRLFIRQAHAFSIGHEIADPTIAELVDRAMNKSRPHAIQAVLKDAILFLDETSILTIHGFCQETLAEFAVETNQLFGADILENTVSVVENEVNKFWREHVTVLHAGLLSQLITHGLDRSKLIKIANEHLTGKRYAGYDDGVHYGICEEDQLSFSKNIIELQVKEAEIMQCLFEDIRNDTGGLRAKTEADKNAKRYVLQHISNPETFVETIVGKRGSGYINNLYSGILQQYDACTELIKKREALLQTIIKRIYCHAIGIVGRAIEDHKGRNSLLSFDDMIINLHKAVVRGNNINLINQLQQKYKAVFVDEFQDTDKLQYEIFQRIFDDPSGILFFIGDPKQSIYSWRKSDVFTYFKASAEVSHTYGMNVNYRSSPGFIRAMNHFFSPFEGFDTFGFSGKEPSIDYIEVEAPAGRQRGELLINGSPEIPITIFEHDNNDQVVQAVTAQIIQLLGSGNYSISDKGTTRSIRPSDIGILVRRKDQANDMKNSLAKHGIPSVTIDETKILASDEAKSVLYLLEALLETNRANINRALLTPFTGFSPSDILLLHEETVLERFREYKAVWDKDGIYSFLLKFVADYKIRSVLIDRHSERGERIITNLFQIVEILHKIQSARQLSAPEVISWLKRGTEGMEIEGDEFEQRVESDEEAVKIVTIHVSKGLEYNIVFAPFLDLNHELTDKLNSYRDPETGEYVFVEQKPASLEQKALIEEQYRQENRRLMYVAITRAVYKCYISRNNGHNYKASSLVDFMNALKVVSSPVIAFSDPPPLSVLKRVSEEPDQPSSQAAVSVDFRLEHLHWRKMSYTSLAGSHVATPKTNAGAHHGGYDRFVFKQLPKGSKTGNLLHHIFETVDFTNDRSWEYAVRSAIKRFMPVQGNEFAPMLMQLLQQVISAEIEVGEDRFRLSDIRLTKRLSELEFDFNVQLFNPALLTDLEEPGQRIHVRYTSEIEGIMNGKMDMFFEHRGKYYVLDWKSNFLGDALDDYRPEVLPEAMSENNYHLQYLLYTLAARKFLLSRLPSFDYDREFGGVIYLFVRGIRSGSSHGIFTWKPRRETVEKLELLLAGGENPLQRLPKS